MKKSLIVLLAFLVVGALAFAAEPTAELKVTEFTGDASVTLGFDIDQGIAAFTNSTSADLKIDLSAGGDKSTSGEGIWGYLKIKSDGDPIRITSDGTGTALSGFKVVVDVAQLNFGTMAYLGIKADGTQLNYVILPDEAAGFFLVDNTKYYGSVGAQLVTDNSAAVPGVNATYGVVLGITPAGIGTFTVDFRSVPQWLADGRSQDNEWGVRAKADITAVANLTAQAGVATSFGPGTAMAEDIGFGAKIAYKVALGDPMFVQPKVAVDVDYVAETLSFSAQAGALFGWGAKSKFAQYFSTDTDGDFGYYPGISAGVIVRDTNASDTGVGSESMTVGLNVSAFTGALVPNLTANAALEILNLLPATGVDMVMGFNANLAYAIAMAPMTLTPKFGIYYYSNANNVAGAGQTEAAVDSDIYVKAGLEIAKIFPNTTLSFAYASNDFNGGVNNITDSDTIGMFATTLKIAF